MYNSNMTLKPQDIVVVLKLCGYVPDVRPSYANIAKELGMSPSEIHSAVKRLRRSRLIHGPEMEGQPNFSAIEEFLIHGVKYSFPAERGSMTRGMPTSYAVEPLSQLIPSGDEPVPVWSDPKGTTRGVAVKPLYKTVPDAAKRDPLLYERLAMVDAIRDGRTRERIIAEKELLKSLKKIYG
jgi:DNA-binding Lrp family transcriptional regulator